jgi:hypothetical protein
MWLAKQVLSLCSIDTSNPRRVLCLTCVSVRHDTDTCDYIQFFHFVNYMEVLECLCQYVIELVIWIKTIFVIIDVWRVVLWLQLEEEWGVREIMYTFITGEWVEEMAECLNFIWERSSFRACSDVWVHGEFGRITEAPWFCKSYKV